MTSEPSAVNIRLQPEHAQILDMFLEVAARGDKSQAALDLTERVIEVNAAHYHAWSYRWQCLEALGTRESFEAEQRFVKKLAERDCKNYQLWNHRRCLAFKLGHEKALEEIKFASECLDEDQKNYHTWTHRQALVEEFSLWQSELEYTTLMLTKDVRNNSAWNQRLFVLEKGPWPRDSKWVDDELDFVSLAVSQAPHNESSWNYLLGFCQLKPELLLLARNKKIHNLVQACLSEKPSCSPAINALANIYTAQMQVSIDSQNQQGSAILADLARQCYERLQVTDSIRKRYWGFCAASLALSQPTKN